MPTTYTFLSPVTYQSHEFGMIIIPIKRASALVSSQAKEAFVLIT